MEQPFGVCKDVFMVGGNALSHSYDCGVYLINAGDFVLIDSGAGLSFDTLVYNIESLDFDLRNLKAVVATHAHIDHIGSLRQFRETFGAQIIAHEMDVMAIEEGTNTGAEAYRVAYSPCKVDQIIKGSEARIKFNRYELVFIHVPGHTAGSIAVYTDTGGKRILFGQDIHGPYNPEWGADRAKARKSLQQLIDVHADILCEGHLGIYTPAGKVEQFIRSYLHSL
jgi:glyoxylase-like metal-dependent hydrolase (beta-lactamase superfamily II)